MPPASIKAPPAPTKKVRLFMRDSRTFVLAKDLLKTSTVTHHSVRIKTAEAIPATVVHAYGVAPLHVQNGSSIDHARMGIHDWQWPDFTR